MLTKKVQGWLGSPGAPAPQIHLAAFGKHPGWDDHIEDLGLDTEVLIKARRVLYSEGVGGNIESGAWEKLEDGQRLAGFGHIVIWRRGWDLVIARLWSSSDGKGRTKYPMVLCVHSAAVPLAWAVQEVLPRLEKAQQRCDQTPRAADVREIVQATRLKLRTALAASMNQIGSWSGDDVVSDRELARLAESPQLQAFRSPPGAPPPPPRAGLLRILYQVEREFGAFAAGAGRERKSALASARAQQIRVPSCGVAAGEAGRLWTGVLLETLADGVDIMTLQALDQRWLDVIVGEPTSANLFCMQASDRAIPLTSDIPYTLDPDFIERAQAMIDAWSGKLPKPKTAPSAPAPVQAPVQTPAPLTPSPDPTVAIGAPQRAMPVWVLLLVVLVLVVAAVITFLALRGGAAGPAPIQVTPPVSVSRPGPVPGVPAAAETGDAPGPATAETPTVPEVNEPVAAAPPVAVTEEETEATAAPVTGPKISPPAEGADVRPGARPEPVPAPPTTVGPVHPPVTAAILARAIESGVDLDEPVRPGGPALEAAVAPLEASGALSAAVRMRVQRLREIKSTADREVLQAALLGAEASSAFEGFAAWRRLTELGWPDDDASFRAFPEVRARVLTLAEGVADGVRRPALRAELIGSAHRAVLVGLEVCSAASDADWAQRLEVAEGAGVLRAEFGPVARYNTVLMLLRVEIARSGEVQGDEAATRARVNAFLTQVEDLDAGLRSRIVEFTAALRGALALPTAATPGYGDVGPGRVGWTFIPGPDPDRLLYEAAAQPGAPGRAGQPDQIEFARVPGGASFLSRTEVPVGVALRAIGRRQAWPEVRKYRLLRMFDPAVNDPRPGPRSWDWSARTPGEAEVAAQWLWPGPAEAAAKIVSEAPAEDVPGQHLSVDAMVHIASLLGCRLPTVEEWSRAMESERPWTGPANLRDAAWRRQWEAVQAAKGRADCPPWPDRGAFKPRDLFIPIDERARPAAADDDDEVWFTPVGVGPGITFQNLVGNVAEVVLIDAGVLEGLEPGRPDLIDGLLGDRSAVRIIGASAMSASELGVDRPWPVDRTPSREGWADVGFRLAFTPPPGAAEGVGAGVSRRVAEVVARARYLGRE